jgi:hypothetical protein
MEPGTIVKFANRTGKVIMAIAGQSLVEYRTSTVYGMITVREWFCDAYLLRA